MSQTQRESHGVITVECMTDLQPEGEALPHVSWIVRVFTLATIILPFVGLLAGFVFLWLAGFHWIHLALFGAGYILTGIGVTVGYHRLFTHRSFETNRLVTAILAILGSMAVEGPLLRWVATHRCHHQHSDREDDPHSPHAFGAGLGPMFRGLFHAHMGWLFQPSAKELSRYIADFKDDRLIRVISRLFPLWAALGLLFPALIAWAVTGSWMGGILGLLWAGFARVFFIHHVTWSVNSVCHLWGSRPFRSHDHSRNNFIVGLLGLGEGWHNNHHAFPTSARHGLRWWEFDISYLVIRVMALIGLARNIRVPSAERVQAKRAG